MNKLKFRRTIAGLTLPEVLVALSIFGAVGTIFTAALGSNFKVLTMADQRTTAEVLAKAQLEVINDAPYDDTSPYTYAKVSPLPTGYDVTMTTVLVNPETGDSSGADGRVQKVTVTVTCQQHTPPEVITVETYKYK